MKLYLPITINVHLNGTGPPYPTVFSTKSMSLAVNFTEAKSLLAHNKFTLVIRELLILLSGKKLSFYVKFNYLIDDFKLPKTNIFKIWMVL